MVLKKLIATVTDDPDATARPYRCRRKRSPLTAHRSTCGRRDFLRECWMMSMVRHPCVIRLEGVSLQPLAMVLEYW